MCRILIGCIACFEGSHGPCQGNRIDDPVRQGGNIQPGGFNRHRNLGRPVFRSLLHIDDIINGIIRNTGSHACRHSVGDGDLAHQIGHDRVHNTLDPDIAVSRRVICRHGFNGYTLSHIHAGIDVSAQPGKHSLKANLTGYTGAKGDIGQHRFIVCPDQDTVGCRFRFRSRGCCITGNHRIIADTDFSGRACFHNAYGTADGVGPGTVRTYGDHLLYYVETGFLFIFTH